MTKKKFDLVGSSTCESSSVPRRIMLLGSVALAMHSSISRAADVQARPANRLPDVVREIDATAMKLFDAAEAGEWNDSASALARIQALAPSVSGLQSAYVEAGGSVEHFIQVVNNLSGDTIEAGTALSTKDQPWLTSCADRIVSRAGELSQPFANKVGAMTPRVDTLLFLARRMRRALVWRDQAGFANAHDSFVMLWLKLHEQMAGRYMPEAAAIQAALGDIGEIPTRAQIKRLYKATQAIAVKVG